MASSENLVLAVLDRLNETGAAEAVDAEDAEKIRKAIPQLFDLLYETNVVLSQIALDAIADAQFFPLRSYVAWKVSGDFGAAGDAALAAEGTQAVEDLKTLARINRGTRRTLGVDAGLLQRRRGSFTRISG